MIKRFFQLPKTERRDLYSAAWRLLVVRLALLFGIRRSLAWLDGFSPNRSAGPDLSVWRRRAMALKRVGSRLPGVACLARAIALRWWMRSAGLDARMLIGARPGEKQVASHAWVELDGSPIDDQPEHIGRFNVIFRS